MASITEKWVRHLRNRDRQEKEKLESLVACGHPSCSSKCRSELEDKDNCRPQHIERPQQVPPPPVNNRISLVSKVNTVYSRLVNVEEVCTQIGQGQPRNSERNPDLNLEQWVALQAIHRTLLHEHNELPVTFSTISPELRHLRKIAHDHSLQSRSLRRFSDCLLPLLKREQDLESARQWLELMKSSSSLLEILGKNDLLVTYEEMTLMNLIDQIEAILERLKQWFRCRYEDLSRKKDVTEEQGLSEPIFEFPNNIRHTCTTMPWTIFPALLVLWGVCWMFIIGSSQPEPEWGNATDPTISPLPAAYDFHADFYGIGIEEGPQRSVADSSDNRPYVNQDTLEELFPGDGQSMSDLIHPLTFVGDIPLDPNFLITDMTSHSDSGNMELAAQDTAEILPAAAMEDSTLRACISAGDSGERDDTGSADSSGYGHPTINSDDRAGETKSRFVCPDCQRTFARPFTLSRHRTERHNHPSSLEAALLCPNRGCKRSKGKPFKREFHLKRHLESCNHSQEDLGQGDDQSCPRPASTSTSASASIHHRQEVGPDKAIRTNDMKRPRVEDDEGSNDGFLLAEMVKKYKKIEKEIEEKKTEIEEKKTEIEEKKTEIEEKEKENLQKQDDLKALGKTIQMLERS